MPEIPDWVKSDLPDYEYQMIMWNARGMSDEEIDMTRDEYIALKQHLAAMRGYTAGTASQRVIELANALPKTDSTLDTTERNIASFLQAAREIYRLCPEAVVSPAGNFDEELEEMRG